MRIQDRASVKMRKPRRRERVTTKGSKRAVDRVSLSGRRWYSPAVDVAKTVGVSALVGAGLASAGLIGGLPAVGLAALGGVAIGATAKARFVGSNAVGAATSFGTAALLGMTGPAGIVGGAAWATGLCLNALLVTNETTFG